MRHGVDIILQAVSAISAWIVLNGPDDRLPWSLHLNGPRDSI